MKDVFEICAPFVGAFYRYRDSLESDLSSGTNLVVEGDHVENDSTVGYIYYLYVWTRIEANCIGKIKESVAKHGDDVQLGDFFSLWNWIN